jgi:hypothetical protein
MSVQRVPIRVVSLSVAAGLRPFVFLLKSKTPFRLTLRNGAADFSRAGGDARKFENLFFAGVSSARRPLQQSNLQKEVSPHSSAYSIIPTKSFYFF